MAIASLVSGLAGPVAGLLDKFIEDKDQKNQLAHDIATLADKPAQEQIMAQVEVNKQEAAHKSLFVAGWRPAIGWICGLGMLSNFIVVPMANFVLALLEHNIEIPLIMWTSFFDLALKTYRNASFTGSLKL